MPVAVVYPERPELERLRIAIESLATSAKPIQHKLVSAALSISPLPESDFRDHEEIDTYRRIMAALTVGGNYEETLRVMDDAAAEAIAQDIWDLFSLVLTSD